LIAVEISRQLHAQGAEPDLLMLFDASVPGTHQRASKGDYVSQHLQNLRKAGVNYLLHSVRAKIDYYSFRTTRQCTSMICRCYRLLGWPVPAVLRYVPVEEAHERLLAQFRLQVYPGKVTLMRAIDFRRTVGTRWNPTLGWDKYATGGLEIHDVPGAHNSMFKEPNVKVLAQTLTTILEAKALSAWQRSIAS